MKILCQCMICDKAVEVDFILPPTEEEKEGWLCEECAADNE